MSDASMPAPRGLEEVRSRTVEALCRHFSKDHLSVDEFERRIDLAHRARAVTDVEALTRDLPALAVDPPQREDAIERTPLIAASDQPERGYAIAIMGGVDRKGRWTPARRTLAYTTWGGISLDFREAALPPGVTELTVIAIMGGVEIIVPPGLAVESVGMAFMGGFDLTDNAPVRRDASTPVLRVRGFAMMGGVEIVTRLPGETARDAKRRRRDERRKRRLELTGARDA